MTETDPSRSSSAPLSEEGYASQTKQEQLARVWLSESAPHTQLLGRAGPPASHISGASGEALSTYDRHALPKLYAGLTITLVIAWLLQYIVTPFGAGLFKELIAHLPMQIYWTFCIYRLSQVAGRKWGDKGPINGMTTTLISLVSFVCMPIFDHFSPRWLDPSFALWAVMQLSWTGMFGAYLERKENPQKTFVWKMPALLSLCTNAYIFIGLFYPALLSNPIAFNGLWFISQFWCILFIVLKLQGKFADRPHTAVATKRELPVVAGIDVVIRYRPFAAIERWIQQRTQEQSTNNATKAALAWFAVPVLLIVCVAALTMLDQSFGSATAAKAAADQAAQGAGEALLSSPTKAAAVAAASALNTAFINAFLSALAGLFGFGTLFYVCQPTHVGIGADGVRFLWRHRFFQHDGSHISWSDMLHISVIRPSGKTSPLDDRLCFSYAGGKKLEVRMGAVDAIEDRETLLKAIKKYAPTVSRDPSVEQALQPPADYSYTELWLQALSAPPKRERLQPLMPGVFLHDNAYKVLETLGAGGQGQAYLAEEMENHQQVVLKEFILPVYVDVNVRKSALEVFENEARILRQLDHLQIVKLLDFFVEDHRAYLVLEHIKGASLRQIVKDRGPLPEKQVRMLALQMCKILGYLHHLSPPVVHRDFTPDNLILNTDGTLKLIDFNVAKQSVESTTSGTVVGKHAYLPPEQFRGMPETESDIYAMGASLFYLLTGQDPEPISVSHPQRVRPEVSNSLNSIVEHATALDLQKRYPMVEQLEQDLNAEQA